MNNKVKITFPSRSSNEGFARGAVAAFVTPLDPTVAELSDILEQAGKEQNLSIRIQREDIFNAMHRI